jgi:hypothetical protein
MQEYLDKHEIERTLEQLSWYIASPDVKLLFTKAITKPTSEDDFQKAMIARKNLIHQFNAYYERNQIDVMLYPTIPILPPFIDDFKEETGFKIPHKG